MSGSPLLSIVVSVKENTDAVHVSSYLMIIISNLSLYIHVYCALVPQITDFKWPGYAGILVFG